MPGKEPELFTINFDLNKLVAAPHAEFVVRLMMAVNDLQSIYHMAGLLEADKGNDTLMKNTRIGATGFLLKMQSSILAEAISTFVKNFPNQGQDSLHKLNKANTKQVKLWKALVKVASDPRFKEIEELRNKLGFHYDHEKHAPRTGEAIKQLITEMAATSHAHESIQDSIPSTPGRFRFILADDVLYAAWRKIGGDIPAGGPDRETKIKDLQRYITILGSTFVTWGLDLVHLWADDNKIRVK